MFLTASYKQHLPACDTEPIPQTSSFTNKPPAPWLPTLCLTRYQTLNPSVNSPYSYPQTVIVSQYPISKKVHTNTKPNVNKATPASPELKPNPIIATDTSITTDLPFDIFLSEDSNQNTSDKVNNIHDLITQIDATSINSDTLVEQNDTTSNFEKSSPTTVHTNPALNTNGNVATALLQKIFSTSVRSPLAAVTTYASAPVRKKIVMAIHLGFT